MKKSTWLDIARLLTLGVAYTGCYLLYLLVQSYTGQLVAMVIATGIGFVVGHTVIHDATIATNQMRRRKQST
ncbi:MAG: hypothetical protein KIS70_08455 [Xanthobacteraceae bacterium]|nr:hypothetical protein [Xanthobacteraceae bacterium]